MDLGCLNCVGKDVPVLFLQTVSVGDPCFGVISWIHLCSPLICHKENTKAMQTTKAYNTKPISIALGGIAGPNLFDSFV